MLTRKETTPALLVLAVACAGQFMVILDVSVVNVALPAIRTSLGFSSVGLQWIVNAYALTFAGFLLLGGRIADLYGRKRVFVFGLALFAGSSLAGGLAHTPTMLIVARAVQGIGAAVLAPATLTVLTTTFTDRAQRARAMASWTAVGAAGGAAGGLIGGVLTQYLSWRWILLINVPIGVVVILLALPTLTESYGVRGRRLNLPGAVLATLGLASLAYGVVATQTAGWGSPQTVGPLAGGVVLLAGFVAVQARIAAPLMPLRLWHSAAVSTGTVITLMTGAAFMSMWFFLSLSLQNVWRYGPALAGVAMLPHAVAIIASARLAPRLLHRIGARRLIILAALLASAGFAWQGRLSATGSYLDTFLGPAVLMCAGIGLLMTPVTTTVTMAVAARDAGLASGLLNAARQVGGSLGLAVLATLAGAATNTPAGLATGYGTAFTAGAVILLLVVPVAFALPRAPQEPAERA